MGNVLKNNYPEYGDMDTYIIKDKLITPENCDEISVEVSIIGKEKWYKVKWIENIPYVNLGEFNIQLKAIEKRIQKIAKTNIIKL